MKSAKQQLQERWNLQEKNDSYNIHDILRNFGISAAEAEQTLESIIITDSNGFDTELLFPSRRQS